MTFSDIEGSANQQLFINKITANSANIQRQSWRGDDHHYNGTKIDVIAARIVLKTRSTLPIYTKKKNNK